VRHSSTAASISDGDGRVYRPDVHHGGVPPAMQVRQAGQWLRTVELEYEGKVLVERLFHS